MENQSRIRNWQGKWTAVLLSSSFIFTLVFFAEKKLHCDPMNLGSTVVKQNILPLVPNPSAPAPGAIQPLNKRMQVVSLIVWNVRDAPEGNYDRDYYAGFTKEFANPPHYVLVVAGQMKDATGATSIERFYFISDNAEDLSPCMQMAIHMRTVPPEQSSFQIFTDKAVYKPALGYFISLTSSDPKNVPTILVCSG